MTHAHRTGRREAARQRRRQRQLLKFGAILVAVVVVVAVALIMVTPADSPPASTGQREASIAPTWETGQFRGGPRLAVDQPSYDHGAVAYGEAVHAVFQLRNVGDEPLTLGEMSVNTLEGC